MVDQSGKPVISRLQPDVMRRLAVGNQGPLRRRRHRHGHPVHGQGRRSRISTPSKWKAASARISIEFYQWLLLPAIVFLLASILAGTRWRGVNAGHGRGAVVSSNTRPARGPMRSPPPSRRCEQGHYTEARGSLSANSPRAPRLAGTQGAFPPRRSHRRLSRRGFQRRAHRIQRAPCSRKIRRSRPTATSAWATPCFNSAGAASPKSPIRRTPGEPRRTSNDFDDPGQGTPRETQGRRRSRGSGRRPAYGRMESLITNWADAVRHYRFRRSPRIPANRSRAQPRDDHDLSQAPAGTAGGGEGADRTIDATAAARRGRTPGRRRRRQGKKARRAKARAKAPRNRRRTRARARRNPRTATATRSEKPEDKSGKKDDEEKDSDKEGGKPRRNTRGTRPQDPQGKRGPRKRPANTRTARVPHPRERLVTS